MNLRVFCITFLSIIIFSDCSYNNENDPSYKTGFQKGYVVGVSDANKNVPRDGEKVMRLAKTNSESYGGDKKKYANGFYRGYNEGWESVKKNP